MRSNTAQYVFTEPEHVTLINLLIKLGVFDKRRCAFKVDFGLIGTRYEEIEPPSLTLWLSESESNSIY